MAKIHHIRISNFKNISEFEADFRGCTAIITGANNSGKSSFLCCIPDRARFIRPEVMVRLGEKEGRGEMILTTGEKFIWEFDVDGKDKLVLITPEGLKHSVTKEIGRQFFPSVFDIDKFLQSPPKSQVKQLQDIVGLDFTEIDERYARAYNYRTERNREAEIYHVKLSKMMKVEPVEPVDLTGLTKRKEAEKARIQNLFIENKKANNEKRQAWNHEKDVINKNCLAFNEEQQKKRAIYDACFKAYETLSNYGYNGDVFDFVLNLEKEILPIKNPSDLYPKEPVYIQEMPDASELDHIDAEILKASETNAAAHKYKEYVEYKKATEDAKELAALADEAVILIEEERRRMIESANFPAGITITSAGILVDGLPLDKNQISTSKLYCAALRIASMNLGEVKTLHFDASFLDKNSLAEIESWAKERDLQLLIERPDFEAGELRYEIIETL